MSQNTSYQNHKTCTELPLRMQYFIFYKKCRIMAIVLSSFVMGLFILSWFHLFMEQNTIIAQFFSIIGPSSFIVAIIISFLFFPTHYKKKAALISIYKGNSLYSQIEKAPRYIPRIIILFIISIALDILISILQIIVLQSSPLFGNCSPLFITAYVIKYIVVILGLCSYIILYKKQMPEKTLYSPLLLS